jgi:3-oxoacyl-[acyl-carrier protein] reductase
MADMAEQKHGVITGASSGIGAALTRALASDGWALYVCARRADKLDQVTEGNTLAFGYPCDVSRENQVKEFVAQVREKTSHVDALINCAGGFGCIGPLLQTDSGDWFRTIEVGLYGTYLMTKHIIPLMKRERGPRIVNFSGGGAFGPFPNYSAYAVCKAGVVRLTENLAVELAAAGISVNAIAPGFVATPIHEATLQVGSEMAGDEHFRRTQQLLQEGAVPMEVPVACVKFLLSDRAGQLTGKTISASFDPWDTADFVAQIPQINQSDLYTLRRINLVNLPDRELCGALSQPSQEEGGQGRQ